MRVLVTRDGSELAERALSTMAPFARSVSAEILLLTVIDPGEVHASFEETQELLAAPPDTAVGLALRGIPAQPSPGLVEDRSQAFEARRIETEEQLQEKAKQYLPDLPAEVHVEWSDNPAEAIARFARENSVDFVAMGTHGRSGLGQALLGSVATSVVRQSSVPVLPVSEHAGVPAAKEVIAR